MMKVGLVLAPISRLVYQGYLNSILESRIANNTISAWNRLFRGAKKSDNIRHKWLLYIKMCRFLIKRYTRFSKKCTPQHTPKGTFGGQIPQIFYAPRFAWRSASPSLGRERDKSNPPQPLGTQQAPNPLILPRAPGAHAFLKCYICIYVIRIWKNFYKKNFYPRCFSYGFQKYQPQPPITLLDLLNFETQKPG